MMPPFPVAAYVWGTKASLIARITAGDGAADRDESDIVGALMLFVVVGLALLLGFLLAAFVLARGAHRSKTGADLRTRKPTASQDVWAMHKVPEFEDEGDDTPQENV